MLASTAWPDGALSDAQTSALRASAHDAAGSLDRAFDLLHGAAETIGLLDEKSAGRFFSGLAAVAAGDVTVARVVEPHLDALGILALAGHDAGHGSRWGVFAAEAPGMRLDATPAGDGDDRWTLSGRKPWCSLASRLTDALVTAHLPDGGRRLFRVSLRHPGVTTHDDVWLARGLPLIPSGPVDFDDVPAVPVGAPGWYVNRPGFAWGGVGVAACWWGGAVGLVDALRRNAARKRESELALAALGAAAVDLGTAERAIADAAARIQRGDAEGAAGAELAQLVRSTVRARVDAIRALAVATLGPAPLTTDEGYLARIADLELYVQQDHGESDLARLGRLILDGAA
jgi:hypothetical protein